MSEVGGPNDRRGEWRPPRWLSLIVGALAVIVGTAVTLKPFSSLDALTIYIAAALGAP